MFPAPKTSAETHPRGHVASRGVSASPHGQGRAGRLPSPLVRRPRDPAAPRPHDPIPSSTHRRHKPSAAPETDEITSGKKRSLLPSRFVTCSCIASCSAPVPDICVRLSCARVVWRWRRETWARSVLSPRARHGTARAGWRSEAPKLVWPLAV